MVAELMMMITCWQFMFQWHRCRRNKIVVSLLLPSIDWMMAFSRQTCELSAYVIGLWFANVYYSEWSEMSKINCKNCTCFLIAHTHIKETGFSDDHFGGLAFFSVIAGGYEFETITFIEHSYQYTGFSRDRVVFIDMDKYPTRDWDWYCVRKWWLHFRSPRSIDRIDV